MSEVAYYKTHYLAKANLGTIKADEVPQDTLPTKSIAASGQMNVDRDLMKIVSILLSIGINKNDDWFLKNEVLPARNTGAHKPMDMDHDPKKIVGHMLRTYVTDKAGDLIPDDLIDNEPDKVPDQFDITNEAVLYKYLLPEEAKSVAEAANKGELFVSVEAWFTDYDYMVGNKIIKRNQKTSAILDEHLRINGGDGRYKGQKIGRVLRNLLIGGIGLVKKPANPDSVIKSISHKADLDVSSLDPSLVGFVIGSEKVETKEMPTIIVEDQNQLKASIQEKEQQIVALRTEIVSMSAKIVTQDNEIKVLKEEKAVLEGKVKEIEMSKTIEARTLVLQKELKYPDSLIETEAKRCNLFTASDEEFTNYCGSLKNIIKSINVRIFTVSEEQQQPKGGESPVTSPVAAPAVTPTTPLAEPVQQTQPPVATPPAPPPSNSIPDPTPAPVVPSGAPTPVTPAPVTQPVVTPPVITPPPPPPAPVPVAPVTPPPPSPVPAPVVPVAPPTPAPTTPPPAPVAPAVPATPPPAETVDDDDDDAGDVSIDSATPVDIDIAPEIEENEDPIGKQFRDIVTKFLDKRPKIRI